MSETDMMRPEVSWLRVSNWFLDRCVLNYFFAYFFVL